MRRASLRLFPFLFSLVLLGTACQTADENSPAPKLPEEPDYAETSMWYRASGTGEQDIDVFYITPTCIWDWQDERGVTYHYMDVRDSAQRAAVDKGANYLASALFGKTARFFSPYYRQITMNSWFEDKAEINRRYAAIHPDIVQAFRYYMTHYNEGRPFVLAGHSQGGKSVIELLKHTLSETEYRQMVAAYVLGYPITEEESQTYPYLIPAKGAEDYGVTIAYNSISKPEATSTFFAGNAVCINPLNWATDTTFAPASCNLGSVFFDWETGSSDTLRHTVSARIDTTLHSLLISGLNDDDYFTPSISQLFPKGNYHIQELNLYFLNIQQNLALRTQAFLEKR